MTGVYGPTSEPQRSTRLDTGRLWAGGAATALVAALIVIVGVVIGRGLFGVAVLAPKGAGVWGDARTGFYALGAALLSLAATGLMQILITSTPRPMRFYGWVIGLGTLVGVFAPFAAEATFGTTFYTACLNLVLGVAIGSLVAGAARGAIRVARSRPAPGRYP